MEHQQQRWVQRPLFIGVKQGCMMFGYSPAHMRKIMKWRMNNFKCGDALYVATSDVDKFIAERDKPLRMDEVHLTTRQIAEEIGYTMEATGFMIRRHGIRTIKHQGRLFVPMSEFLKLRERIGR